MPNPIYNSREAFNPLTDLDEIWVWFLSQPFAWLISGIILIVILIQILKKLDMI